MDLNTFLQQTFADLAQKVPGFISVALVSPNGVMASYPSQMKKELELISPFYLQIYQQAINSMKATSEGDSVKEILITTERKLYVLESKTQKNIGMLTLDVEKANLGLAKKFSEKVSEEVYKFFKDQSLLDLLDN